MSTALRLGLPLCAGVLGLGVACLIPDQLIVVESSDQNPSAVRFVEGIPLGEVANDACGGECPMATATALPYFLNPDDPAYQFCICSEDLQDAGQLPGAFLYAEDQDANNDGSPADLLYAAALLDWDPTTGDPATEYVAYRSYVDPQKELQLASAGAYQTLIIKRPRPNVRTIPLSFNSTFDLCNGAGRIVGPGLHTLAIMVTDRPWTVRDPETGDSSDSESTVTLEGVPDIAAGATYDIQSYVFNCYVEGDVQCGCEDPEP